MLSVDLDSRKRSEGSKAGEICRRSTVIHCKTRKNIPDAERTYAKALRPLIMNRSTGSSPLAAILLSTLERGV